MSTAMVLVIIIAVIAIAAAFWFFLQNKRSAGLRSKFGPEYDRQLRAQGDRRRAEAMLEQREKRMEKIHIRALKNEEIARFSEDWRRTQALFVDDPRKAVEQADTLVQDVMNQRGYPVGDFEQRAADVSVDHPVVVNNYRAAHAIALRDRNGQADTEDLRQAMVHFRSLFEELLGTPRSRTTVEREHLEVR